MTRGDAMRRLTTFPVSTSALLLGAALVGAAVPSVSAQQQPTTQDVVGTWKLISEKVQRGGQTTEPLGSDPLGLMMLDRNGRVMMTISRRDLAKITANRRDAGTPEENKEVLSGLLTYFGTYTVTTDG